jgi:sporulation protein YlmC with PRC-barrel domain
MSFNRSLLVISLGATAAALVLPSLASAQVGAGTERDVAPPATSAAASEPTRLVSELLGTKVVDDEGERVGEVTDLVIVGNEITTVALAVGGVLGIGEREVALPYEYLRPTGEGAFAIGLDGDSVEALPTFDASAPEGGAAIERREQSGAAAASEPAPLEPLPEDPELAEIDPRLAKGIAENEAAFDERLDHESFDNDAEPAAGDDAP